MTTFCYYSELSTLGACRMCVAEDARGKINASCSMEPRDGMKIRTNTEKLLKHRRMILKLILSSHCRDCTTCEEMQGMGILNFAYRRSELQVMPAFGQKLAETNCISCGQCAAACPTGAVTIRDEIGRA